MADNPFTPVLEGIQGGMAIAQRMEAVQRQRQEFEQSKQKHDIALAEYSGRKLTRIALLRSQDPKLADMETKRYVAEMRGLGTPVDQDYVNYATSKEHGDQLIQGMTNLAGVDDSARAKSIAGFVTQMADGGDIVKAMEHLRDSNVKMAQARALADYKLQNLDYRQTKTAELAFNGNKALNLNLMRLDGVARVNDLLQAAEQGKIVTNQQVTNLIGEEVARLELGAGQLGLGQSERNTTVSTFKSAFAKAFEKSTGKPQDAITKPQLKQMTGQLDVMTESYMNMTDRTVATLKAGMTPTEQRVADAKTAQIKQQYTGQFGYWGKPNGATASEAQAIKAAGADPSDRTVLTHFRQYQQLKGMSLGGSATTQAPAAAPVGLAATATGGEAPTPVAPALRTVAVPPMQQAPMSEGALAAPSGGPQDALAAGVTADMTSPDMGGQ